MRVIELNNNQVAIVDYEDFEWIAQWRWHYKHPKRPGHTGYAVRTSSRSSGKRRTIWMHREIMSVAKETEVDHINGNGLDNRRSNLRNASRFDNTHNRKKHRNNTTGFKGVCFHKQPSQLKPFKAAITANGIRKHIGSFDTAEEAAAAYDRAAKCLHGQFARLNAR